MAARRLRGQRLRYRFHFADFVSGTPLAMLPLRDAKLSEVLSGASDGSGVLPLNSATVLRQDPFRATIPRRTTCWAERIVLDPQNRIVSTSYPWGGVVMGRQRSRSGQSLALQMVSWAGYFQRRLVRDQTHVQADRFDVFRAILDDACSPPLHLNNSYPEPLPTPFPLSSLPYMNQQDAGGTKIDRTYLYSDLKPALEEMRSLGATAGFDWRLYPYREEASYAAGLFRVGLALGYPRLGRVAPADLVWSDDENDSDAGQLFDYTIVEDGQGVNNRVVALGEGQGPTQLRTEVSGQFIGRDELLYGYPLWEGSLKGSTSDLRTQATLDAHARAGLAAGFAGETRLSGVRIRGDLMPTLDRWNVGDDGTFRIGSSTTGQPTTIVGQIVARTIEPPQQGRPERVTLDLQGTTAA